MIPYKQISLADIFKENKPQFLSLLTDFFKKHPLINPKTFLGYDTFDTTMVYVYPENDLRTYPGTVRDTEEWDETYKIRTTMDHSINHVKDSFGLAHCKTQNEKTLHANLILFGITQLITVVLAGKIHHHEYIQSLKPFIA